MHGFMTCSGIPQFIRASVTQTKRSIELIRSSSTSDIIILQFCEVLVRALGKNVIWLTNLAMLSLTGHSSHIFIKRITNLASMSALLLYCLLVPE